MTEHTMTPRELAAMLEPGADLYPDREGDRPVVFTMGADCLNPECRQTWRRFRGTWLGVMEMDIRRLTDGYHEPPGRPANDVCGGPVAVWIEMRPRSARGHGPAYRRSVSIAGMSERIGQEMLRQVDKALGRRAVAGGSSLQVS